MFSLENIKKRQQTVKKYFNKSEKELDLRSMRKSCCGIQLMLIEEGIQSFKSYG
jgi:hypothetical protein